MDLNQRIVFVHTKSIESLPMTAIHLKMDEPISRKVISVLSQATSNIHEKEALSNRILKLYHGVHKISDCKVNDSDNRYLKVHEPSLNDLQIPDHHPIHILAEFEDEDIHDHYKVVRFETPRAADVDKFHEWLEKMEHNGVYFDVWHSPRVGKYADVKLFKSINPKDSGLAYLEHGTDLKKRISDTQEQIGEDFHESFHTYENICSFLNKLNLKFNSTPKLKSKIVQVGVSCQNAPIYGLVISKETPNMVVKPKFLMMSGIHSREWAAISTNLFLMDSFANTEDAKIQTLLNHCEIHFIPVVNVDGYAFTWGKANRLWRKNLHNHFPHKYAFGGVDVNRNFDSHFNEVGASTSPLSEIYGGPSPLSEKESESVIDYIKKNGPFLGMIDWHCYKRCFAFPLSHTKQKHCDYDVLMDCATATADAISSQYGKKYEYGQISHIIYPCSGVLLDWVLEKGYVKFPYVNEVDGNDWDGFLTKPKDIWNIGMENLTGLKTFLNFTLSVALKGTRPHPSLLSATPYAHPSIEGSSVEFRQPVVVRQSPDTAMCRVGHQLRAMDNLGTTCYLNSVIQCFGAIKELSALGPVNDPLANNLVGLLSNFWENEDEVNFNRNVVNFYNNLVRNYSKFNEKSDASEFAMLCVEKLKQIPGVEKLFSGSIENRLGETVATERFHNLYLPLSGRECKLESYVKNYFEGKRGSNWVITEFPSVLLVTLKIDPKKQVYVTLSEDLDLSDYSDVKNSGLYNLTGVVSYKNGHYISIVKHGDAWLETNDSNVKQKKALDEDVCNPHVLFFVKNDNAKVIYY